MSETKLRSVCRLLAEDDTGCQIEAIEIPLDAYYEALHEIIDSADHRRRKNIRRLVGTLFDASGSQVETFENTYDATGRLTSSVATYPDGAIHRWPDA